MQMTADDLTKLAADLADEHGSKAAHFARRAVVSSEQLAVLERMLAA